MPRTFQKPFPSVTKQSAAFGARLKLARLRRKLSTVLFSERVGVSRDTLNRLEKGDPNIALGTYMRAMRVLGLDRDIDQLAGDDELGRKLQDVESMGGTHIRSTVRKAKSVESSGAEHIRPAVSKKKESPHG